MNKLSFTFEGKKNHLSNIPLISLTDSKGKWKSEKKYNFRWIPTKKKELCIFEKVGKNRQTVDNFP